MGMYINSATSGLLLTRSLYQASAMQTNIMKRLSSGIRINSASDDAAGLSLSQKLTSVINGNTVAKNNAQTGIAMLNTADGALSVMTNSLERIRNLAVQAANGVYSNSERQMLQKEVSQLSADIQQTHKSTSFNGKNVFGESASSPGAQTVAQPTQITEAEAVSMGYDENHIIRNASDLNNKIWSDAYGNFVMVADIDMSSEGITDNTFLPNFYGTFDGNGHTITNLHQSDWGVASNYFGLFPILAGTVKNLNISGALIDTALAGNVGIIAGDISGGTVDNCNVSGTINAGVAAGGITGTVESGGTIKNCSTNVTINSEWRAGGIAGMMQSSSVINCSSAGSIMVNNQGETGGLIGFIDGSNNIIKNSSSSAYAFGNSGNAGGLIGSATGSGTITDCYATGNAEVNGWSAGGLVGGLDSGFTVNNSYATGNTYAFLGGAGGFVGGNSGTINACYATGSATVSQNLAGGFAGNNSGTITNSYSTGSATGGWMYTGGFTGSNSGTISSSYATGTVNGGAGGFNGGFSGDGPSDTTNFYINNMSSDPGFAVNGNISSLPTSSWDPNVWNLSGGVPTLGFTGGAFVNVQVGDGANIHSQIQIDMSFGLDALNFDVSSQNSAQQSLSQIDDLMSTMSSKRSTVGASVNKLSSTITIQDNRINNLSASKSTINDTDMAAESANMVKAQIRTQASIALISQVQGLDANLLMQLLQ